MPPPAIERHRAEGHVADGVDGGIGGAGSLVHHHARLAVQAAVLRELRTGRRPNPHQHRVACNPPPIGQSGGGEMAIGPMLQVLDLGAREDLHAPASMQGLEEVRKLLAGHPRQHPGRQLDDGRLCAKRPGRGGGFQADIAPTDDQEPFARLHHRLQPIGVGEVAKLVQVVRPGAGKAQLAVHRSRRENQLVVSRLAPAVQPHQPLGSVDRLRPRPEAQGDGLLAIEAVRLQLQVIEVGLALEIGLGERRPLIRRGRLLADKGDRAGMAPLPEQGRGRPAGVASAHDHYPRGLVHRPLRPVRRDE